MFNLWRRAVTTAGSRESAPRAATLAPGFEIVPYPRTPLEQLYVVQNPAGRTFLSKHTRELQLSILAIAIGLLGLSSYPSLCPLLPFSLHASCDLPKVSETVLAAGITVVAALVAGLYQIGILRFSTVDIFSSEIAARMRTLAADNSVARIISGASASPPQAEAPGEQVRGGDAYSPSQESQFETFHRRSGELGALGAAVVDHVTAFYSYHLAARDELRLLPQARTPSDARTQVFNVIFMVDLMAMSAIQALDDLIETDAHRVYCRQLALCVGTQANAYLMSKVVASDHRFAELQVRNETYATRIKELKRELRQLKSQFHVGLSRHVVRPVDLVNGYL